MDQPLVSIIIPCFNVERTIEETLESVFKQTYPSIEVIVVIDGSTDNSSNIVKGFAIGKNNMVIHEQENKGLPATRNVGFLLSSGEYVLFLDADDLLDSTYIESCVNVFIKDSSVGLVYTQTMLFEAEEGLFDLPDYSYKEMLIRNCIPATALIRRDVFQAVGMYDVSLPFVEDWELWLRYTRYNEKVVRIERPLFFYRKRYTKDSMTDLNKVRNVSEQSQLYIYNKHYAIYKEYNLDIDRLLNLPQLVHKFKMKYYGVWHRKMFYKFFKPNIYRSIFESESN